MKIALKISYDGTNFCGWQVQPNGRTVQEEIEKAVEKVTGQRVRVTGSGRTDAGVHAKGQVAHLSLDVASVPPERLYLALNAHLPEDVRVLESKVVADDFDACRTAKKKTYKYSLYLSKITLPLKERYAVKLDTDIDLEKMRSASKLFLGEHDFKSFCASGSSVKTTVRTIYQLDIDNVDKDLTFTITGNGFLYNMVRIIVGTLVKVGEGKATEQDIISMLNGDFRSLGGKTLQAKGLCLENVEY